MSKYLRMSNGNFIKLPISFSEINSVNVTSILLFLVEEYFSKLNTGIFITKLQVEYKAGQV